MLDNRGLWRGKTMPKVNSREFNNVWVKGNLIQVGDKYYIHPIANRVNVKNELGQLVVMHEVDPKTLGECTTLPDMRRNLIFEGDFLQNADDGKIGLVAWNGRAAGFVCRYKTDYYDTNGLIEFRAKRARIIGNIHDNPEMLKAATGEDAGNAAQDTFLPAT